MDPLLAKGKPISEGGSTSGITYLRRKKNLHKGILQPERGVSSRCPYLNPRAFRRIFSPQCS